MARRIKLATTVFDAAIDRLVEQYAAGHRIIVSFSGGKDSTVALELCVIAATLTDRLPVEVITRDEEINFPGTYEYIEQIAQRPDVSMRWILAGQPIINCYNRAEPYFWVFDPLLDPSEWVRQPPSWAERIGDINIDSMVHKLRYPVAEGQDLISVIGLRTAESKGRMFGIFSSGGYMTQPNKHGVRLCRPIYDFTDADIWKAIKENGWGYAPCYDVFYRMGIPKHALRIAPPTMNTHGLKELQLAAKAWPRWFDKVAKRCPGVRLATQFGMRAITPNHRIGESWQETFERECIQIAPEWIAIRATQARDKLLRSHVRHSNAPYPEHTPCNQCTGRLGSWRTLTLAMYGGDPFSVKLNKLLPQVDPDYFRPGSGHWQGPASW